MKINNILGNNIFERWWNEMNDEKDAAQHMIFIVIIITMSNDKKRWQFMTTMEVLHFNLYNKFLYINFS